MSINDRVDILLATYNGEKYLKEQLESILTQTHQNFCILIRDDLSSDSTPKIIETYVKAHPDKIRLIPSKENLGVKCNFSALMEASQASYVMFADQDDCWMQDKIAKTLDTMKSAELKYGIMTPLLVHSDLIVTDESMQQIAPSFWAHTNIQPHSFSGLNRFLTQNMVTGCTMMLNKSLRQLAYPIPQDSPMHDWWIALVASAFGKIEILNEPTILYRQHASNTLGAKKFGSIHHIKERLFKYSIEDDFKLKQATTLLKRYNALHNAEQKELIKNYIQLKDKWWIHSRFLIFKYQFFKCGFLRNLVAFFIKTQP